MKFFKFCEKLMLITFDFLLQVMAQRVIIDLDESFLRALGQKRYEMDPKQSLNIITWNFCMILQ